MKTIAGTTFVVLAVLVPGASAASAQTAATADVRPGAFEVSYSQMSVDSLTLSGLNVAWTLGESSRGVGLLFGIEALSNAASPPDGFKLVLTSIYGGLKFAQRSCRQACAFGQLTLGGTGVELSSFSGPVLATDKAFMIQPAGGIDLGFSERVGLRAQLGWRVTLTDVDTAARGLTFGLGLIFGRW